MNGYVIFVDDEPSILRGLRRVLHRRRQDWDLAFAEGAEEALELMAARPADIVISDLRMPQIDGPELLNRIRQQFPRTTRIALSGHAEETLIRRCVGVAHQYLAKPTERDEIEEVLERTFALRAILHDPDLEAFVVQLTRVPSVPDLYEQIQQELSNEDPRTERVAEIIGQDPSMTAKILQLVNSAFFARRVRIGDVGQAVSYLGLATIKNLVLGLHVFSPAEVGVNPEDLEAVWHRSLEVARITKMVMKELGASRAETDDSLSAGLLHAIGQLALWEWTGTGSPRVGPSDVGAYLLGLWGLPHSMVEAVAFQDRPSRSPAKGITPLTGLHIAKCLFRSPDGERLIEPDESYFEALELSPPWDAWAAEVAAPAT